jgi:hypothetical protein
VDWPACSFYEELMERHPDAKVLLSVRDPERWYESTRQTIYKIGKIAPALPSPAWASRSSPDWCSALQDRQGPMAEEIIWQGTFDGRFEDKDHAIGVFDRHNEEVQRRVPQEQLLVYEVKQGWGPLCEFLGVEEPDKPFPHLNDAAEIQRLILWFAPSPSPCPPPWRW